MSVFVETKDQSLPFLVGLEVEDKEVAEAILFILEAGSRVKISPSQLTKHVCSSRKPAEFMKAVFKQLNRFRYNGLPLVTLTETKKKGNPAYYIHVAGQGKDMVVLPDGSLITKDEHGVKWNEVSIDKEKADEIRRLLTW